MTFDVPDELMPLIVKALQNQSTAQKALNREDSRCDRAAAIFQARTLLGALERKGPAQEALPEVKPKRIDPLLALRWRLAKAIEAGKAIPRFVNRLPAICQMAGRKLNTFVSCIPGVN